MDIRITHRAHEKPEIETCMPEKTGTSAVMVSTEISETRKNAAPSPVLIFTLLAFLRHRPPASSDISETMATHPFATLRIWLLATASSTTSVSNQ